MNERGRDLRLRITVVSPPPGVHFQLQRGRRELEPSVRTSKAAMTFELDVRVGRRPTGEPNFLGPFVQGPPAGRFVYINSGTLAGQADSCWTRRAKVPLTGITWALIERAGAVGSVLETEIAGTGAMAVRPVRRCLSRAADGALLKGNRGAPTRMLQHSTQLAWFA